MEADDKTASEYLGLVGKQKQIVDELEKQHAEEMEKIYQAIEGVKVESEENQHMQSKTLTEGME